MLKKIIKSLYKLYYSKEIQEQKDYITQLETSLKNLVEETSIIEPKSYDTINISELYLTLDKICPNVYISDENLNLTIVEEARKFSNETKVQYRKWVNEDHDCDNFSFAAMGYWSQGLKSFAYGIAWSNSHAFNIFIDSNKQIWIVEPQTNKYTKLDDIKNNSMYYPLRVVLI